jgi:hypothetical protein
MGGMRRRHSCPRSRRHSRDPSGAEATGTDFQLKDGKPAAGGSHHSTPSRPQFLSQSKLPTPDIGAEIASIGCNLAIHNLKFTMHGIPTPRQCRLPSTKCPQTVHMLRTGDNNNIYQHIHSRKHCASRNHNHHNAKRADIRLALESYATRSENPRPQRALPSIRPRKS